jgi:DNA-binding MurR/RpiR family transcriptional regulator
MKDFIAQIYEKMPEFSKGQRMIARYIAANYEQAVFLTAQKLGKEAGVSESTVVRFAMTLGYEGYPQFQAALEEYVKTKLQMVSRLDVKKQELSQEELLEYIMNGDIARIHNALENLDRTAFWMAVDLILQAEHVYIAGVRSCSALAQFLGFYLNMIRPQVHVVTTSNSSELFEQMIRLTQKDVVIGISFPRYSMRTLKALEFASSRQASIIAMTDSEYSPLTMYSSCNLFARSDMSSVADSLVAPMSLLNALIMALSLRNRDTLIENIETLEQVWKDYAYEDADEMDWLSDEAKSDLIRLEKNIE